MVLMDVIKLDQFLNAVNNILRPGGSFIFSVTHPCFWPAYYGYSREHWYRYEENILISGPFKITGDSDCSLTSTHVHRPISKYIEGFSKANLSLETLLEPMPDKKTENMYPSPWKVPRYLFGVCSSK